MNLCLKYFYLVHLRVNHHPIINQIVVITIAAVEVTQNIDHLLEVRKDVMMIMIAILQKNTSKWIFSYIIYKTVSI